jgi:hypothetical protein
MSEQRHRLEAALAAAGPIIGTASGDDGAVTVEVEVGGRIRAVRLTRHALRYGGKFLADTVLSVAAKATAKANQRAHQVYVQALGSRGESYLDQLGLSYDPSQLADEPAPPPRRARAAPGGRANEYGDDPADYPETWMRRR